MSVNITHSLGYMVLRSSIKTCQMRIQNVLNGYSKRNAHSMRIKYVLNTHSMHIQCELVCLNARPLFEYIWRTVCITVKWLSVQYIFQKLARLCISITV